MVQFFQPASETKPENAKQIQKGFFSVNWRPSLGYFALELEPQSGPSLKISGLGIQVLYDLFFLSYCFLLKSCYV